MYALEPRSSLCRFTRASVRRSFYTRARAHVRTHTVICVYRVVYFFSTDIFFGPRRPKDPIIRCGRARRVCESACVRACVFSALIKSRIGVDKLETVDDVVLDRQIEF